MPIYDSLKVFHILSATILLASQVYCIKLWASAAIARWNLSVLGPLVFLQLLTGFSLLSLKHYSTQEVWVPGSVISFLVYVLTWSSFSFFLLQYPQHRFLQKAILAIWSLSVFAMLFFMANKIPNWSA